MTALVDFISRRRVALRTVALGAVPLLLLLCGVRTLSPEHAEERSGQEQVLSVPRFRTVVIILDSLGTPMAFNPSLMPFVSSLRTSSLYGEATACPGKATFPCLKSIFEGRTATTGTTLQDFSAVESRRTTWPASVAGLGHRVVLTSDHTLNRLYPDAFAHTMNYEDFRGVPLLQRDEEAYRRARKWLADRRNDVFILHIIGTDKVSHDYEVGGPVYQEKFREADDFVREVADQLGPTDYLFVIGDHGHNELGGHTLDAAYLARGPIFPRGQRADIDSSDMLFLLSAPYALTLPPRYEGQLRTELLLMPEDQRRHYLAEQARLWQLPTAGTADELQVRLNSEIAADRLEGKRAHAIDTIRAVMPWLMIGAAFLIALLGPVDRVRFVVSRVDVVVGLLLAVGLAFGLAGFREGVVPAAVAVIYLCWRRHGTGRTIAGMAALALLLTLAFWVLPSGLSWYHNRVNQPKGLLFFYPLAALAGVAVTWFLGAASMRQHLLRILWTVALCIWLLAYFSPYAYALPGLSTRVVLAGFVPAAIIISGGFRAIFAWPTLLLFALWPLASFQTESFNIKYRLMESFTNLPFILNLIGCTATGLLWARLVWLGRSERNNLAHWAAALVGVVGWILVSRLFFEFESGKILGALCAGLFLIGVFELFRRVELPLTWSGLVGAFVLFAAFHFVMDGFALSHVDFRFTAGKIIPFQEELWRALQQIAWTMLKYLFVLLPVLAVFFISPPRLALAQQLLQFGWWREVMIVASALGLSLFDPRGVDELCREEVYFWTFLNIALFLLCLFRLWAGGRVGRRAATAPVRLTEEVHPASC